MERKLSQLLERLLDKSLDNKELEELFNLLNKEGNEEVINNYLQKNWTEKVTRTRIDSEGIYNEMKDKLYISNIQNESDELLFNQIIKPKPGRILTLTSVLKYAAAIIIAVLSTWMIMRSIDKSNLAPEERYNIVSTPLGSKTSIILPDGTSVWLNSESTLKYPVNFNEGPRKAFLTGEAYFEVSKNNHRPFILATLGPEIEVLGTKFNVRGYPDDVTVITTLFEGKVKLTNPKEQLDKRKEYILRPEQEARFEMETNEIKLSYIKNPVQKSTKKVRAPDNKTNIESVSAWKEGKLIFEDENFDEIVVKLHRWYGMNIHIMDNTLKSGTYSGTFKNHETIYQVLETINRITPISINVKDNDIYISSKKDK